MSMDHFNSPRREVGVRIIWHYNPHLVAGAVEQMLEYIKTYYSL
jgi:hypothetical protein